jgi:DNA-binding NtrC family response regulator
MADLQLGSAIIEDRLPKSVPVPEESAPNTSTADAAAPHQQPAELALAPGQSLEEFLEAIERRLITEALEATRWNKTAAAKQLGITFRALRYRLKKLELE